MKQGDRRYTIETHRSGQPRPYADTVHDFTLKIEWVPYKRLAEGEVLTWEPNDLVEELVVKYAKSIGFGWVEKGEGDWASPHLSSKTKVGPGEWRFVVTEAFTD